MPLGRARVGRRRVLGGPVARTAAVVGTAAVVKHGTATGREGDGATTRGVFR